MKQRLNEGVKIMCGKNSNLGLRNFGSGFVLRVGSVLLLLFVASPLWAANWAFLNEQTQEDLHLPAVETQEATQLQEVQEVHQVSQEPISKPSTVSTEYNPNKLPELLTQLNELETQLKKSVLVTDSLRSESTDLKTKLEAYEELERIEDEEHQAVIDALAIAEETNTKQADEIVSLSEALKKSNKSKGYVKLNGLIGCDDDMTPEYGAGLSIGFRAGKHLLLELGANYMVGSISNPFYKFSMKNLVGVVSIGWEF